jgi:hypothetical protein
MTAEEFLYNIQQRNINRNVTLTAMKKFAKYHVEQALKEAVDNMRDGYVTEQDEEDILNCYPLTNIK